MKLSDWIKQNSTVEAFGEAIERSRMQVHRYMRGENLTIEIMAKIEEVTEGAVTQNDLLASAKARKQSAPQAVGATA